ncbi:MAG: hypothetical protein IJA91_01775 [Clostridia bacterium]|nr:hypothetical protein [Clostridia bacterium]
MKKIFAILVTVAMLLAMGTMMASAVALEGRPGADFTPGGFSSDAADFTPAGDFEITWDPNAASKLDLTDGNMEDWAAANYNMVTIDVNNMVYWVNDTTNGTGVPEGWSISTYFVADSDWLYIGFYVTDPVFAYILDGDYHSGDAFQVCIDFGGRLGKMLEETPDEVTNPKNIFYSFGCVEDGAPIKIMRQESDNDGWISEENGDGVKGAARKTETGWAAEFALSWEQLYDDYSWKSWDDKNIYVGGDQDLPLEIGCCLYYLDYSETKAGATLNWAAGSTNGIADENGTPCVSWSAYDNGLNLSLPYNDGMTFNCDGIVALERTETIPVETDAPETEAPTAAPETAAPETAAPETDAATQAPVDTGVTETTGATTEDGGCSSVVAFGAVAVVAAAAAAVVLKKKD